MKQSENSRNTVFNAKTESSICEEIPSAENPYLAQEVRWHGFELFEIAEKLSPAQAIYLLLKGEVPTPGQAELLSKWWILSMNPGPRHPAVRAAMNSSVGKSHMTHMMPIGLSVMGGEHLGAMEVKDAYKFLKANLHHSPEARARELYSKYTAPSTGDGRLVPGMGTLYGGVDLIAVRTLSYLANLEGASSALTWCFQFGNTLAQENLAWVGPGIAAATFMDLGFTELESIGCYQFFTSPGLLAHGNEMIGKALTSMPFPKDDHYIIEAN